MFGFYRILEGGISAMNPSGVRFLLNQNTQIIEDDDNQENYHLVRFVHKEQLNLSGRKDPHNIKTIVRYDFISIPKDAINQYDTFFYQEIDIDDEELLKENSLFDPEWFNTLLDLKKSHSKGRTNYMNH